MILSLREFRINEPSSQGLAHWGGQISIFGDHFALMILRARRPHRSHLPVVRLCRKLVKKSKVPTYLPLSKGKKLRQKSKVPTYLPLLKGQKVPQNSKVPTYLPLSRVKKNTNFRKVRQNE